MTGWRLAADVGGTNVRFAVSTRPGRLRDIGHFALRDFPSFSAVLRRYLAGVSQAERPGEAAIAVAGPVIAGTVRMTNAPWAISAHEISEATGAGDVRLVNDLEAVARALPELGAADADVLQEGARSGDGYRALALNVGTGFGAAGVISHRGRMGTLASEAGHMAACALTAKGEDAVRAGSVEDVLSGRGVAALYRQMGGEGALEAKDVFARAAFDDSAAKAVLVLSRALGLVSANMVLAHAAWDGVFLTGSVACGWHRLQAHAEFLTAFRMAGPMAERLQATPIAVITRPDAALFGLSYL